MSCNCMSRCRTSMFVNVDGREYPASTHFTDCEKYQPERFVRVELDGTTAVMESAEAEAMQRDDQEAYKLSDVYLTRDQFKAIPEFSGF